MESIIGHSIYKLPFSDLEKKSDLMEYDGPLLSHFIDRKKNNYLFYWVDNDNIYNRWLIWKIEERQLFRYLKGYEDLNSLLLAKNKDFVYSVEIDNQLEFHNVKMIEIDEIPNSYIPEENSYFRFPVPSVYTQLREELDYGYVSAMREKAIFFKLTPNSLSHLTTVSTSDAADFLKSITRSFMSFIEEDFLNSFGSDLSDQIRTKKIIAQLKKVLSPRIVELNYGSFEVGISTDNLRSVEMKYNSWQKNILNKYRDEVIGVNYESDEELNSIAERYSEDARKKIFLPIIELINNDSYTINSYSSTRNFERSFSQLDEKKKEIIVPKKLIQRDEENKKRLYSFILELDSDDPTKISKAQLNTGLLFSTQLDEIEFHLDQVISEDQSIIMHLKKSLSYKFSIDADRYYRAEIPQLDLLSIATDSKRVVIELQNKTIQLYLDIKNSNSVVDKAYKLFFDDVIERIEFRNDSNLDYIQSLPSV